MSTLAKPWYKKWWLYFLITVGINLVLLILVAFFLVKRLATQIAIDPTRNTTISTADQAALAAANSNRKIVETTDDPSIGLVNAPITIVEFSDFSCPYSRQAVLPLKQIYKDYPEKIRIIYRDFPIAEIHPLAPLAAEAASCAWEQGKFWLYHDQIFANQDILTEDLLFGLATSLNLDAKKFNDCLKSEKYKIEVYGDLVSGASLQISATPTFFINGFMLKGAIPYDVWKKIIPSLLSMQEDLEKTSPQP